MRRSRSGLEAPRRGLRRLVAVPALSAVVLSLAAVLVHGLGRTGEPAAFQRGHRPVLFGRTVDGRPFDPASLWGRPVVVSVWASWCDPCREELPLLAALARRLDGVRFLGVNLRDTATAARTFLRESGAGAFPHLADPDGRLALELGARGVPETFLLDVNGLIAGRAVGAVTEDWVEDHVRALSPP